MRVAMTLITLVNLCWQKGKEYFSWQILMVLHERNAWQSYKQLTNTPRLTGLAHSDWFIIHTLDIQYTNGAANLDWQ